MMRVEVREREFELRFRKHVIVAYTDICAAGCRALMGIQMRVESNEFMVPGLVPGRTACVRRDELDPTEEEFLPLQVLNCKYEEYTLVLINTILPGNSVHLAADKIMHLCKDSNSESLTILSTAHLDIRFSDEQIMFENCLNDANKVTSCRRLPSRTLICDPFLCTILQMTEIDGIPTNIFMAPGYKALCGAANYDDRSKQNIGRFQRELSRSTGLRFDTEFSHSLIYKEKNDENIDMASSIYA